MGRKNALAFAVLAAVILFLPVVVRNYYDISVLVFTGINVVTVTGLSLLMGYAGQISLGHAGFMAIGAYTSGLLTAKLGVSAALAFVSAAAIAALVALIVGIPTLRLRGHYLAMATLAFGEIIYKVVNDTAVRLTGGNSGFGGIPTLRGAIRIVGVEVNASVQFYYTVWIVVLVLLALSLNLVHSRVGRALRAIHSSELAARVTGVDARGYKVKVFVLSAVYAAIAGSLYAHFITHVSPTVFTVGYSVQYVTMAAVGGMSSIWGALFGAGLLTALLEYLRFLGDYRILVNGVILIVIMMFAPGGLAGAVSDVWMRLRLWLPGAARSQLT